MKILQVNCVWRTGSTGRIAADLHEALVRDGVDAVVCYGRGAHIDEQNVYKTCGELYSKANNLRSRLTGLMYGGCEISTHALERIISRERPDVVHLHCINGYFVNIYHLIRWLKARRIKTVLTLHAEFMYTANCGHALDCERWRTGCGSCPRRRKETKSLWLDRTADSWRRMRDAFDGFERDCIVTSVSPWLKERASSSPILAKFRHRVVLNGLDARGTFFPRETTKIREKHSAGDRKVVIHVTPSFSLDPGHIKGGWYVAELARRMPEVCFLVIGSRDTSLVLPENVCNVGRIEDPQELAAYYSAADACLLTSRKETFSLVTAESLCCGTPVVGFKAGAPEQIALPEYSAFVPYGDTAALETALRSQLAAAQPVAQIAAAARAAYDSAAMYTAYRAVYGELGEITL